MRQHFDVDLLAYDPDPERVAGVQQCFDVAATSDSALAFASHPELVMVCGPTSTHLATARRALSCGAHLFIEKPISHTPDGVAELLDEAERAQRFVGVGSNMRFATGPATLRQHLHRIEPIHYSRAAVGYYLPYMRRGVDYRSLYAAQRKQGGGVLLDDIHEIDYHVWLFGEVAQVSCQTANRGDLEMDAEDYAHLSLCFTSGMVSQIDMDYLNRCRTRNCEIIGQGGTLVWEERGKPSHCTIRLYTDRSSDWQTIHQSDEAHSDACYVAQLRELFAVLAGKPKMVLADGREGLCALRLAFRARESAADRQRTRCCRFDMH